MHFFLFSSIQDVSGEDVDVPFALSSLHHLRLELENQVGRIESQADVKMITADDETILAHHSILSARWPWFRQHCQKEGLKPDEKFVVCVHHTIPSMSLMALSELSQLETDTHHADVPPPSTPPTRDSSEHKIVESKEEPAAGSKDQLPHHEAVVSSAESSSVDQIIVYGDGKVVIKWSVLTKPMLMLLLRFLYSGQISFPHYPTHREEENKTKSDGKEGASRTSSRLQGVSKHDFRPWRSAPNSPAKTQHGQ